METFQNYKGFGIRYFAGITTVEKKGVVVRKFSNLSEIDGKFESNKTFQDQLLSKLNTFNPKKHTAKQVIDELTDWAKNLK